VWEKKIFSFFLDYNAQLVRYSQMSFYFNEFQISMKEKNRGSLLDVTIIFIFRCHFFITQYIFYSISVVILFSNWYTFSNKVSRLMNYLKAQCMKNVQPLIPQVHRKKYPVLGWRPSYSIFGVAKYESEIRRQNKTLSN